MPTLAELTALLTKPPSPSSAPPPQASGKVTFYADGNWGSTSCTVDIREYRANIRTLLPSLRDGATWVAFNLPVGTVMTLTDNDVQPQAGRPVWDLYGVGRCIDLVGTGQTVGVNLIECNMNDCVSSFYFRTVNLNLGAIELFDDWDYKGGRTTIFLSDWPPGKVHSLLNWWISDRASSARWQTLNDRQTVSLYDNTDASGRSYDNIKGWGETKQIPKLGDVSFSDCISAFRWDGLVPKKEVIEKFTLDIALDPANTTDLQHVDSGTNKSTASQQRTVTLRKKSAQSVTVTSTETHVAGVKVTADTEYTAGPAKGKLSVELSYEYTNSSEKSETVTNELDLEVSDQITVPPNTNWTCTLVVQLGNVPPTAFTTKAVRWYDQPVNGGTEDPANNNWFKRTEDVTGTIRGGLRGAFKSHFEATPI